MTHTNNKIYHFISEVINDNFTNIVLIILHHFQHYLKVLRNKENNLTLFS